MDIKRLAYVYSIFAALEKDHDTVAKLKEIINKKQKNTVAKILLYNDKKEHYN